MAEHTTWVELHVEAWEQEKRDNGQAISDRGRNTVQRKAHETWRRRLRQTDRDLFANAAGERQSLTIKIATLTNLPPEPDTEDLDILSPWYARAWDLLVARRRLRALIPIMFRCIPRNGVASVRTRVFLQTSARTNVRLAREGVTALNDRLGPLPDCRPSNYIDILEQDSPDVADVEDRRIPNYMRRRLVALTTLVGQLPAARRTIALIDLAKGQTGGIPNERYRRYLHAESEKARSVAKNLTELINGLTAWSVADTAAIAREEAKGDATPDVDDRIAYQHHLLQWEECAASYRYADQALSDLIALRAIRGDAMTADLEVHLGTLHGSVVRRMLELEIGARYKQTVLEEHYSGEDNEAARLQSLPVLPWSRVQDTVGAGAFGQVEAWIKTDHNNNVVDRLARKVTSNSNPNDNGRSDVWRPADRNIPTEVAAMYKLRALKKSSNNVIQIRNWRPVSEGGEMFIIYMNLCQHGDLAKTRTLYTGLPGRQLPPEAFVWSVVESLADAGLLMERGEVADSPVGLHNWTQIVHGDMKVANVLLDENVTARFVGFPRAILADFGRAIIHPIGHPMGGHFPWKSFVGKGFTAPEQSLSTPGAPAPDSPANVWGIGMIVRTLIQFKWEIDGDHVLDWTEVVINTYSNELIDLLGRCLDQKPGDRPTLAEIKKAATMKSGDVKHDAAIDMRNAKADDPRWEALKVLTTDTNVPVALARDADGDVEMVGGPTGQPIRSRLPSRSDHDSDDDAGDNSDDDPDGIIEVRSRGRRQ